MSKPAPKPEESADDDAVPVANGSKKKKLIVFSIIGVVVLALAGGGTALFLGKSDHNKKDAKKAAEKSPPAVFLTLENFTVNIDSDMGDKYLQAGITLQVRNEEQSNYYKSNMPQLRSRILLLLSSKSSDELLTNEGKLELSNDIIKQAQIPFNKDEQSPKEIEERKILGVFFTSFMIQ